MSGSDSRAPAAKAAPPVKADAESAAIDPAERPGASGHRFGPDLACSECGIHWDAHQREPMPCEKDAPGDVFLRRPQPVADVAAVSAAPASPVANDETGTGEL